MRAPPTCSKCGEVGHIRTGCEVDRSIDSHQRWVVRQRFSGLCVDCPNPIEKGCSSLRCPICRAKRAARDRARRRKARQGSKDAPGSRRTPKTSAGTRGGPGARPRANTDVNLFCQWPGCTTPLPKLRKKYCDEHAADAIVQGKREANRRAAAVYRSKPQPKRVKKVDELPHGMAVALFAGRDPFR